MCFLENGLWLLKYVGRPTQKMIENGVETRKTTADIKINPTKYRETLRKNFITIFLILFLPLVKD